MERTKVKQMRTEMQKTLEQLGEQHGIAFTLGTITFDDHGFTASIKAIDVGTENIGDKDAIDRAKFERDIQRLRGLRLQPEHFHKEFQSNGTTFKIVGVKPRSTKYPIIAENESGTRYKFPAMKVLSQIN